MKKQFRLYDIYRNASLNKQSVIQGIREYTVKFDYKLKQIQVNATFYNYETFEKLITIDADAEAELKEFVKRMNKRLKNCKKPGPKPHQGPKK